jgi:thiol-disulfide isomerase/thioredoxin
MNDAADPESPFRRNLSRLNRLIDSGSSFSGYERNCAFLNLGAGKRFATVSNITGFDFDDDARAIGLCDWDRDGDLDVWVQNRTAPMLRYLRNDLSGGNRSLQIRLQGTKSNRDAIGARVEISTSGGRFLAQTLKAGEGFLSQGSKWLHFGLGADEKVNTLTVSWPGGAKESVGGAPAEGRFVVIEGRGKAVIDSTKPPLKKLARREKAVAKLVEPSASRSALAARFPLPPLRYQTFKGLKTDVVVGTGKPILINIWASWCAPCAAELKSLADRKAELDKAGLEVVALSVDGLADDSKTGQTEAKALAGKLDLPFTVGMVTPETLRRIEFIHNLPFGLAETMPVPTSLLVDRSGGLAAIYRGKVEVETILEDLAALDLEGDALLDCPLPFPEHRWIGRAQPQGYFAIPIDLIEQAQLADASTYLITHRERLRKSDAKRLSFIHGRLGVRFEEAGKLRECIAEFEAALSVDPGNVEVSNNLAWQLSAGKDKSLRDGPRALQLAQFAAKATGFKHPAVLDTLAAALAQSGRYREALQTAQRGVDIARKAGQKDFLKSLKEGIEDYSNSKPRGG